jgi:hypothetical protein
VNNTDPQTFANSVIGVSKTQANISPEFYKQFYWGYITKKAAEFIQGHA